MRLPLLFFVAGFALAGIPGARATPYWSPFDAAVNAAGDRLAVSDLTAGALHLNPGEANAVTTSLNGSPRAVAWRDNRRALVAEYDAGTVAEVDALTGAVTRRFAVGPKPVGVAVAGGTLLVTDCGLGALAFVDLATGETTRTIPVTAQPFFVAASPNGARAAVGHLISELAATAPEAAASVSLIDVPGKRVAEHIRLPYGSGMVRDLEFSPGGRWVYVVHTLGRTAMPTTQLERGWINTNALTIIDATRGQIEATVLLDRVTLGAADPWGIALSPDGSTAWITLAGAHEVARLDLAKLHGLLDGTAPLQNPTAYAGSAWSIWSDIRQDPARKAWLPHHLSALFGAGMMLRAEAPVDGPRAVVHYQNQVVVAGYFSGELIELNPDDLTLAGRTPLGVQPELDEARRGEMIFHDARFGFQQWLSCSSCHPEGRADGLNWDLLNDGIGNQKNAKSLLWTHQTPPSMSLGVRADWTAAVKAGLQHFLGHMAREEDLLALQAYLASMAPEDSPYLIDGELGPEAIQGREIFNREEVGCASCHPAPLFTDLRQYDVGTGAPSPGYADDVTDAYDTPTLVELWRSGPFLHDGRAASIREVLTTHNEGDRHGAASQLTAEELDALITYLLSL